MHGDDLSNWFTAQEDRFRRQAVARTVVLLTVGCLLVGGVVVVAEAELVQAPLEIAYPSIVGGSR